LLFPILRPVFLLRIFLLFSCSDLFGMLFLFILKHCSTCLLCYLLVYLGVFLSLSSLSVFIPYSLSLLDSPSVPLKSYLLLVC
jgi:hypothetical protein